MPTTSGEGFKVKAQSGRLVCDMNTPACERYTCEHVALAVKAGADPDKPLPTDVFVLVFRHPVVLARLKLRDPASDGMREVYLADDDGELETQNAIGLVGPYDGRRALRMLVYETVLEWLSRGHVCESAFHFTPPMSTEARGPDGRYTPAQLANAYSILVYGMCRACHDTAGEDLIPDA